MTRSWDQGVDAQGVGERGADDPGEPSVALAAAAGAGLRTRPSAISTLAAGIAPDLPTTRGQG
ncbi:MAG: hypothetical protein L0H93_21305 [Nocardioides sp.]|nr:hypothetical protein [Nocardioides sp.]